MAINYQGKEALNLQEAVRDLDARIKAIVGEVHAQKPVAVPAPAKPTVTERVDKMLEDVASHKPAEPVSGTSYLPPGTQQVNKPAPEPAKTTAPIVGTVPPKV